MSAQVTLEDVLAAHGFRARFGDIGCSCGWVADSRSAGPLPDPLLEQRDTHVADEVRRWLSGLIASIAEDGFAQAEAALRYVPMIRQPAIEVPSADAMSDAAVSAYLSALLTAVGCVDRTAW